jgi:hypothetical protein
MPSLHEEKSSNNDVKTSLVGRALERFWEGLALWENGKKKLLRSINPACGSTNHLGGQI